MQRLVVHPAEHQDLAGVVLLHDRRHETLAVALEARGDVRSEGGHGSSIPAGTSAQRTACCATQLACSRP